MIIEGAVGVGNSIVVVVVIQLEVVDMIGIVTDIFDFDFG